MDYVRGSGRKWRVVRPVERKLLILNSPPIVNKVRKFAHFELIESKKHKEIKASDFLGLTP